LIVPEFIQSCFKRITSLVVADTTRLKPNSITLAGSKLVRSWSQTGSKPNSITLSG